MIWRSHHLTLRLSPEERALLQLRALECGRPVSTYVREVALGSVPRARRHLVEEQALYHLGRVGNNLNQLARTANATQRVELSQRLAEVLDDLQAAIRRLV